MACNAIATARAKVGSRLPTPIIKALLQNLKAPNGAEVQVGVEAAEGGWQWGYLQWQTTSRTICTVNFGINPEGILNVSGSGADDIRDTQEIRNMAELVRSLMLRAPALVASKIIASKGKVMKSQRVEGDGQRAGATVLTIRI